jgi:hypothetical protein
MVRKSPKRWLHRDHRRLKRTSFLILLPAKRRKAAAALNEFPTAALHFRVNCVQLLVRGLQFFV